MITIEWNKTTTDSLDRKLKQIISNIAESAKEGVKNALESTQQLALEKKKGKKDITMIPFTVKVEETTINGRLYTDRNTFAYASFLEYGTGVLAEREHIGTTKTFIESGFMYWFLPVEKADRDFGINRIITIKGKQFYIMYPQPAQPFMRPAGFENRDINIELVMKEISDMIVRVIK